MIVKVLVGERKLASGDVVLSVDLLAEDGRMAGVDAAGGFKMPTRDWQAVIQKVVDAARSL